MDTAEHVIDGETLPLFHQPGKQGYYAPILGSGSVTRLNAFRNVGRLVLEYTPYMTSVCDIPRILTIFLLPF